MIKLIIRVLIATVSAAFLAWFLAPIAYGILNVGNAMGIIICIVLLFRTAFAKLWRRIKERLCKIAFTKVLLRVVQSACIMFIIYAVIVSGFMVYAMIPRADDNATAVVLGAQVKPWGPSALLQQRIDAAEEYLNANPHANAVLTGGQGSDEIMSEAECMEQNMIADGFSADRLYKEDKATNTDENIRFSLKIIDENELNRDIAIVSDSYHQLRARIIAHKVDGALNVSPINTVNGWTGITTYPTYFLREWIAIPVEIIK